MFGVQMLKYKDGMKSVMENVNHGQYLATPLCPVKTKMSVTLEFGLVEEKLNVQSKK